ncbi:MULTISPECIES: variant leucine-rich repeat-containing protein [Calothrix]|uniref:Leucine rich repeat variant domain-containing protein n=2 Tax=Calothrix TaxID=1186 RepID=A0ABR8A7Y1_9CYAN|nr:MULTISPECIES: hypothetical protein [Calothrix]MBD2195963.1 hypothetical protein [Calothrix parietina FACHB-288]MBD2224547.1 hypothetical protein [Calothrix anomala FACHB-343]
MSQEQETALQEAANENTPSERLRELAKLSIELARIVAQNPGTDADILHELGSYADAKVRQNLLMNPNIPPSRLMFLAKLFPRHLFRNPAIDLLILENPNLLATAFDTVLPNLIKRKLVPVSLLEYAAKSSSETVKLAVTVNSQTPKATLEYLASSNNQLVVEAAQMHVNWNDDANCEDWQEIAQTAINNILNDCLEEFKDAIQQIAKINELRSGIPKHFLRFVPYRKDEYDETIVSELEEIAQSEQSNVRLIAAKHPNTPARILEQLLEFGNRSIFYELASNPNTPVHVLEKLLQQPDLYELGRRIAGNPNLPLELLEEMADSDRHNAVHAAIASNPRTPVYILEKLASNQRLNSYVHQAIAYNPNTPVSLLEKLARDRGDDYTVRNRIANNPKTPKQLVLRMLWLFELRHLGGYSLYSGVEEFGMMNPHVSGNFLEKLLECQENTLKTAWHQQFKDAAKLEIAAIAGHPNLPEKSLKKLLLEHEKDFIRYAACDNPNTPNFIVQIWGIDILKDLNQGIVNVAVLKRIAASLYANQELLAVLVNHEHPNVRKAAASNPCIDDAILASWESSPNYQPGELESSLYPERELLSKWEQIPLSTRLTVLLNPQAPKGILAKIARSFSWLERYAIAQNSNTPTQIRQILTQDGNRVVRAAASFTKPIELPE